MTIICLGFVYIGHGMVADGGGSSAAAELHNMIRFSRAGRHDR